MISKRKSPSKPLKTKYIEITLEIETGNLIHRKFDNKEDLLNFLNEYTKNPKKILEEIKPKKKQRKLN